VGHKKAATYFCLQPHQNQKILIPFFTFQI